MSPVFALLLIDFYPKLWCVCASCHDSSWLIFIPNYGVCASCHGSYALSLLQDNLVVCFGAAKSPFLCACERSIYDSFSWWNSSTGFLWINTIVRGFLVLKLVTWSLPPTYGEQDPGSNKQNPDNRSSLNYHKLTTKHDIICRTDPQQC